MPVGGIFDRRRAVAARRPATPARRSAGRRRRPCRPSASSTARSMTFSSSRMLPGQLWRISTFCASGWKPSTFFFSSPAKRLHEELGQRRDVVLAIAQRRHLHRDDVQAVEQVLAEPAFLHHLRQVAVGRRDDADVDAQRPGAAEALELVLLQHAQDLRLRARAHVADFVEEQRAAVGLLEAADALLVGARERALLVTEQFGLEQVLLQRRAVDLDERAVGAVRVVVDRAGDQLLAGARLAADREPSSCCAPPSSRWPAPAAARRSRRRCGRSRRCPAARGAGSPPDT